MTDYYVRPTNGSDAADGLTFGNAFKSYQKGIDTAGAGDSLFLCAEATETITATIDIDTNNGTAEAPIKIEGRDSTDGSTIATYTVKAIATWGGGAVMQRADGFGEKMQFKDIIFDANSQATNGFDDNDPSFVNVDLENSYIRCRYTGGTGDGFTSESPTSHSFILCEFDNNGGDGYASTNLNDGRGNFYHCSFHDNTTFGCFMDDDIPSFNFCEFYGNGDDGLFLQARSIYPKVQNCTAYNNGGSGFYFNSSATNSHIIMNNTSSDNAVYGFEYAASDDGGTNHFMDYNHTHNNTSGATNLTGGMPGDNNQTGDPQFANITAGSEDFTPANGSPLDSNGINGIDIGARKAADPAGGAGGICKLVGSGGLVG